MSALLWRWRRRLARWMYPGDWIFMEMSIGPNGTKVWANRSLICDLKWSDKGVYAHWWQRAGEAK